MLTKVPTLMGEGGAWVLGKFLLGCAAHFLKTRPCLGKMKAEIMTLLREIKVKMYLDFQIFATIRGHLSKYRVLKTKIWEIFLILIAKPRNFRDFSNFKSLIGDILENIDPCLGGLVKFQDHTQGDLSSQSRACERHSLSNLQNSSAPPPPGLLQYISHEIIVYSECNSKKASKSMHKETLLLKTWLKKRNNTFVCTQMLDGVDGCRGWVAYFVIISI